LQPYLKKSIKPRNKKMMEGTDHDEVSSMEQTRAKGKFSQSSKFKVQSGSGALY